jgi:hypothetical protein
MRSRLDIRHGCYETMRYATTRPFRPNAAIEAAFRRCGRVARAPRRRRRSENAPSEREKFNAIALPKSRKGWRG